MIWNIPYLLSLFISVHLESSSPSWKISGFLWVPRGTLLEAHSLYLGSWWYILGSPRHWWQTWMCSPAPASHVAGITGLCQSRGGMVSRAVELSNMTQVFMQYEPERALNFRFRSWNIRKPWRAVIEIWWDKLKSTYALWKDLGSISRTHKLAHNCL